MKNQASHWRIFTLIPVAVSVMLLAACASVSNPFKKDASGDTQATSASATTATAKPATAPIPTAKAKPAWMNANGEVTDSKAVEAGYGEKVKGMNDWEGEITGKPAPGSKFTQLKIGMGLAQVQSIVGTPTDQGAYMTAKAWIPWYFGSDKHRHELAYKGMGRLIFAGSGGFDTNAHLVWIIHNKTDTGFR